MLGERVARESVTISPILNSPAALRSQRGHPSVHWKKPALDLREIAKQSSNCWYHAHFLPHTSFTISAQCIQREEREPLTAEKAGDGGGTGVGTAG